MEKFTKSLTQYNPSSEGFFLILKKMIEILKQLYDRDGLKAQMVIIPILGIIQIALNTEFTLIGNIFSFVKMYLGVMFIAFLVIYLGNNVK